MKNRFLLRIVLLFLAIFTSNRNVIGRVDNMPNPCVTHSFYLNQAADLVYLDCYAPSLMTSARYATNENLTGIPLDGYFAERVAIKLPVAKALLEVNEELRPLGYQLVIYDGYRPQRAVRHFVNWQKLPEDSHENKMKYYPNLEKSDLFCLGYISEHSVHCTGYAVDLTLIKLGENLRAPVVRESTLSDGQKISVIDDGTIDMGTSFDFMHEASNPASELVSEEQFANRIILKKVMLRHNFEPIAEEWWHFNYKNRHSTDAYDFPIR